MKRIPWWFAALNLALVSFHASLALGWNEVSRALTLVAIVEDGSLRIDSRQELTGDKALVDGHYYSDKAPGAVLLALPAYALVHAATSARLSEDDDDLASTPALDIALAVGTVVSACLPFLGILLLFVHRLEGAATAQATASPRLVSIWLLYGSYVFVYADHFYGHVLTAFLLLAAYVLLFERDAPLAAGVAIGLAVLTEYPAIVALAVWTAQAAAARRWRGAALVAAGALPGIVGALAYNTLVTGHPLTPGYQRMAQPEFAPQNGAWIGFGLPNLEALWDLVFGAARGLLFHAPVLLVFLLAAPRRELRPSAWARSPVLAFAACHLLLYSSFYQWEGGSGIGDRYLLPAAVLLLYRVGDRLVSGPVVPRAALHAAGAAGLLMNLLALNTTLYVPPSVGQPLAFLIGEARKGLFTPDMLAARLLPVAPAWRIALWLAGFALLVRVARDAPPAMPGPAPAG